MSVAYSFHLSAKGHAVTSTNKIAAVSKHNLRDYKSNDYDRSLIEVLSGSDSILDDVKKIYHREFDEALETYNAKQKRSDRKIKDYLQHVSDSRSDVAAEIIIQVGDMDFWVDKSLEQKRKMSYIFRDQLRYLQRQLPDFKVASAVIHYDENSPHLHVVGVPVAGGYKKGLSKQVAKTKVFTQESLSRMQDVMRARAERGIELNQDVFEGEKIKDKEKGRNKDLPKQALNEFYELKNDVSSKKEQLNVLVGEIDEKKAEIENLRLTAYDLMVTRTKLKDDIRDFAADIANLPEFIKVFKDRLSDKTVELLKNFVQTKESSGQAETKSRSDRAVENPFLEKQPVFKPTGLKRQSAKGQLRENRNKDRDNVQPKKRSSKSWGLDR